MKCIPRYVYMITLVLAWRKSIHFWRKIDMRENDVYIFVSSDLDLWALDLKKIVLLFTLSALFSIKLEVSTALQFGKNRKHGTNGRTDRRTECNA